MADTYHQVYVQLVWATAQRIPWIKPDFRETIQRYITGVVTNKGCKLISIFAMPDHVHLLVGLSPAVAISDLVKEIKEHSTLFIRKELPELATFSWQRGYGAFSYSKSHIPDVAGYIENQEEIHRQRDFKTEYRSFLRKFNIEFEEKYAFDE
jgi:REP element-mobilizing transposase RayT